MRDYAQQQSVFEVLLQPLENAVLAQKTYLKNIVGYKSCIVCTIPQLSKHHMLLLF